MLLELFKKLPVDLRNSGFVDYGCGKGRALFCAEYSGFNNLIGVELDKELLLDAEENLKSYSKKRAQSNFTLVHQNAIDFKIPEGNRVFYFFNPFSEAVMQKVMTNILNYRKTTSASLFVVYVNPKFDTLWRENGFSELHKEKSARYTEAIIYQL